MQTTQITRNIFTQVNNILTTKVPGKVGACKLDLDAFKTYVYVFCVMITEEGYS